MVPSPVLLWFRHDLRLADNPALLAAAATGRPVLPVFIWSPGEEAAWPPGAASRWWLHQALIDLATQLTAAGSRLTIRTGPTAAAIHQLGRETGARGLFYNRRYEPAIRARDSSLQRTLRDEGWQVESFNSALLFEPGTIANNAGQPFKVFTPFFKKCLMANLTPPVTDDFSEALRRPLPPAASEPLADLRLLDGLSPNNGLETAWRPTRAAAQEHLDRFLAGPLLRYSNDRNYPGLEGTSRLSPYLHCGQIGPREVAAAMALHAQANGGGGTFFAELIWREFAHHVLYHFPLTASQPLRSEFAAFPTQRDETILEKWRDGLTGYPIVDAGMRQLRQTGWMHNRVRMVVASFLVKHLLHPWLDGARWFWETLVDADLASNTLGWQWAAGCGADAAPFFRVFNPILQGGKFDPAGDYVRLFVPELAGLAGDWIHQPWEAPPALLSRLGLQLGHHYPRPVIEHSQGRERALAAFELVKRSHHSTGTPAP